jgi:hypothetical protein
VLLPAIDLLTLAIERVRPLLNRHQPLNDRVRILWAAVKNAQGFAASDVLAAEFFQVACEKGLKHGFDDPVRRILGEKTVRHVVSWALRGMNPFETGLLL